MPVEVLLTAAAVAGIVALFQGSAALYNTWKSRKEAQHRGEAEVARRRETETSLTLGSTRVQGEYDRQFACMGPCFARGDEIGRLQLMTEHIALQQTVISCLQQAILTGHLDLSSLTTAANSRRNGSIRALTDQYQRMSTAAPLGVALPAPRTPRRTQSRLQIMGPLPAPARTPRATPRASAAGAARQSNRGVAASSRAGLPSGPLPAPR